MGYTFTHMWDILLAPQQCPHRQFIDTDTIDQQFNVSSELYIQLGFMQVHACCTLKIPFGAYWIKQVSNGAKYGHMVYFECKALR